MKLKLKLNSEKVIKYIKLILILLLLSVEILICAQAYDANKTIFRFAVTLVCCFLLTLLETVNAYIINKFAVKMVFYGFDSALLLTICILTGNSFLSTAYCIVLTQCYMSVDRFKDRTILFGVSCGLFAVSFIAGWLINNPLATLYNSIVEIVSGILFGLLAIIIDYIIVQFLLKFYRTNIELSRALKEADESRARLEEAYEQLTLTKVYEERNRIAKDIHDNAGHSMTTVIMQTEAAKLLIDKDPTEAKNRIISANIQARNALEQMRESVHLLAGRSGERSLKEEIEEVIAQTVDGTDIKARCSVADVQPQNGNLRRFIVNSVKELLSNGIRHGKATAFYIELKSENSMLFLLVSDNGSGVNGDIKEGFGLKSIREKAEYFGGNCEFSGEEGEGFEAIISLPCKEEEKND